MSVTVAEPLAGSFDVQEEAGSPTRILTSDPAVLVGLLLSLGLFYLVPGLISAAIGGIAFLALTVYRPQLSISLVPLVAPLFYRPRTLTSSFYIPLPEFVILSGVAAWLLRDVSALISTRRIPQIRSLLREPGILLAGLFGLIGLLWLFVPPDMAHRKIALREFRWTVAEPLMFLGLMLRWLRTERDVWRMVAAWLVTAALVGREGVEQYLFGQTWNMEGVGRVTSVYPSATAFGIYIGRALPLALTLAVFLPSRWLMWRIAAGLLALAIAGGVLFSFARGAWIGVVVAMVVVALLTRYRPLMLAIGAGLIGGLLLLPFIKVERITSMFNFSTADNTGVSRLKIWTSALRVLRDHPFTGIGQDQFLYVDPKYEVPQLRFLTVSHPHNWVLDFWLRLGAPGLVWIVAALAFFYWQAMRFWQTHRGTAFGALALGLLASMVDFTVHGLLDMAYFTMDLALTGRHLGEHGWPHHAPPLPRRATSNTKLRNRGQRIYGFRCYQGNPNRRGAARGRKHCLGIPA